MMIREPSPILARMVVLCSTFALVSPSLAQEAGSPRPTAAQIQFFESQVRPVLVESCQSCHGAAKVKAGLRLDSRPGAIAGGESGPAVVAGKPAESLLIERVTSGDMPPKGKLPRRQVEALTQWVEMGAPWPGGETVAEAAAEPVASNIRKPGYQVTDADRAHWSFRPLKRPDLPAVAGSNPPEHPIDRFIAPGLAAKGLKPNPQASRGELIRRATYDLTGLPPSPAEVDAFEADTATDAYEKLVDRLLASPRYGEKWGRHWLDLVRFAETNSYERDGTKPNAWRYRDYVIRSMNADKPYDRFIREQLAGDELPDGGHEGLIATGYYRLGLWDDEPADRDQARYDGLDDIVATTSQVFLGLTVDCARCHDHKLDPIPQKDYYRFLSFFQNVNDYRNGGPTDEAVLYADDDAKRAHEASSRALAKHRDEVQASLSAIEAEFRARYAASKGGNLASIDIEDLTYRFYRDSWDSLPDFDALKPEDTGKLPEGRFTLGPRTRDEAFGFVFEGTLIVPSDGVYSFHLDSDDGSRLSVAGTKVVEHDQVHGEGEPKSATVSLRQGRVPIRLDYFQAGHGLGLSLSWSGPGFESRPLSSEPTPAKPKPVKAKPSLNQAETARLFRSEGKELLGEEKARRYRELRRELDTLKARKPPAETALVVSESGPEPKATHLMLRGNPHSPGDQVEPAFLQVATTRAPVLPSPPPGARTTGRRTVLADWIASPENPLTPRVMANRVWQHHFGRGIVRSSSNVGTQGDKPTHPELLDWLATELIAGGWKLKPLHRTIMTSEAYKRSSRSQPEALAADPQDDLLWRFEMRRLTAEEIRDSILAVTGSLSLKMYGPGVYPEIPAEVMAGQSVPGAGWKKDPSAEDQSRRSIYVHIKRSLLVPILESYDVAETDRSSPIRFATTQPTQALGMINGTFINRQSVALAARLRNEAGADLSKQVELGLRLITDRKPTEAEIARGVALIASLKEKGTPAESALASFCLVALNLDEFIYLD